MAGEAEPMQRDSNKGEIRQRAVERLTAEYTLRADPYSRYWAPVLREFSQPLLDVLPLPASG
jgi:hypothetical protein